MSVTKGLSADKIYEFFKAKNAKKFRPEYHCKLLIEVMMNKDYGCHSAFCIQAMISESTFYRWLQMHELFSEIYFYSKMVAKQLWYEEGRVIRDTEYQIGTMNYAYEHWKLMGWTKFGISRNSKIRVSLDPKGNPASHYAAILKQASDGDFTASEFKQLMEAVNVGLNAHKVYELQKQIDELKSDLATMAAYSNGDNPFANKGTPKAD